MMVSVAMTTYNGEEFLERQLQSVLSQLGETDELVVSDDGSTDSTRRLLDKWAARDPRVKVIDGPQRGVIKNFEHAIASCKGEYIFLCDQDDEWDADKVAAVMRAAERDKAIAVMHDARVIDEHGHVIKPSFFETRNTKTGLLKNLWKNSYIGCCMAFSRELKEHILPFPDSIPMHDQWIGLIGERHGRVVLIDRPLMSYRRHSDNVTADEHGSLGTMLGQRLGMIQALCKRR